MAYESIKRKLRVLENHLKTRQENVGKRYGRLVIMDVVYNNQRAYAVCKCDCGNEKTSQLFNVKHGITSSCGCYREENRDALVKKAHDTLTENKIRRNNEMIGKRFGRLVIKRAVGYYRTFTIFECLCDCGNVTNVLSNALKQGTTKSCGCFNRDKAKDNVHQITDVADQNRVDGTNLLRLNDTVNKNNKSSGVRNVYWDKDDEKWRVMVTFQGKKYHLGRTDDINEAKEVAQHFRDTHFKPLKEKYK